MIPFLIHRNKWENYNLADPVQWISNKAFYDYYYLITVVGGWLWLAEFGILCCVFSLLDLIKLSHSRMAVAAGTAIVTILVLAITRNVTDVVVRVLE